MAVSNVPQGSSVTIKVQKGTNVSGSPTYVNRKYSSVKVGATDQNVYDVALALAGLQSNPVSQILRINESNLVNG